MKYLNKYLEHINENKISNYLSEKKINGEIVKIKVKNLKPAQNEIFLDEIFENLLSRRKFVKKSLKGKLKDNEIIISSDNYIIDGHHKWSTIFVLNPNAKIKCTKINQKLKKAIELLNDLLEETNAHSQRKSGLFRYNIYQLIKDDKNEMKQIIKKLFNKKSGNEKTLLDKIKKISNNKHPLNYLIHNIYNLPTPDDKNYDRNEMPQLSDDEIKEIID